MDAHRERSARAASGLSRGSFLRLAAGSAAARALGGTASAQGGPPAMRTRPIPASGEALPVVGLGTWVTFDVGRGEAERAPLRAVLRALFAAGGSLIDTAPIYGPAEGVVGDLLAEPGLRGRPFVATKVMEQGREEGVAEMERSFEALRAGRIDLMQVHNLVDWRTQLKAMRALKEAGRLRYLGVTHYTDSGHAALEAVMREAPLDFVQVNLAIDDREAEARVLPLAAERGMAVIVNQPFRHGELFRAARGRPLPGWAAEIGCASWAQVFLKHVLAHPAVTCVVPATANPAHMAENAAAGSGALPDTAMRARMAADWAEGA